MRLPHPLRFSEGGNLCGLHRAGFLSVCVTLNAPRTKSKSQDVESIVSHPLKMRRGWGSLSWFDGRVGQPPCSFFVTSWDQKSFSSLLVTSPLQPELPATVRIL